MDIFANAFPQLLTWAAQRLECAPWDPAQVCWLSGWIETEPVFVVCLRGSLRATAS
jgi:hypothetical protein